MDAVFLIHHVRSDDEYADDAKLIGAYRSQKAAAAAVERLRDQLGFRDHPHGWEIQRYELDQDHWVGGFLTSPDASLLSFSYEPVDEAHGKLIVVAESGDFSGRGEAWFTSHTLRSFGEACKGYPIQVENPPSLDGGYWDDSGTSMREVHLSLRFESDDARGTIRAVVQLASSTDVASENPQSATIRFFLTYADLGAFASCFLNLIDAAGPDVTLRSSPRH